MTYAEFEAKWIGKRVDVDGVYGFQLNAPVSLFSLFSRLDSFVFSQVKTEKMNLIIDSNPSFPFVSFGSKSYPRDPTSVVNPDFAITNVSRVSDRPKIRFSVIKRIAIYMVYIQTVWLSHYPPVKLNKFVSWKPFLKIGVTSFDNNAPLATKFFKPHESFAINDSFKSSISFGSNYHRIHKISLSYDSQKVKV